MTDRSDTPVAQLARLGVDIAAADPARMELLGTQLRADAAHLRRALPFRLEPLGGPVSGAGEQDA